MKQITFIDSANIKIKGGRGGDGGKYFHKEKYIEYGGPSGGNGGNGGSIFLIADNNENTLLNYKGRTLYKGEEGVKGFKNNMTGASGGHIYLRVPVGTEVLENDKKVVDLTFDGQIWVASKGGKGGRGNASFKSATNTTPSLFENGEDPKWREFRLNLKVLADVGLLGFPNAGKSTLLSVVSNAKPKIDDYEFTTLVPQLGVVKTNKGSFVMTDLPGLIEGASLDKGMGIQFLKHLSRTKVILHLIDPNVGDWKQKYEDLRFELKSYSKELFELPEIIAITKTELLDDEIKEIIKNDFDKEIYFISAITHQGIHNLNSLLEKRIIEIKEQAFEKNKELDDEEFVYIKHGEDKLEEEWSFEYRDNIWTIRGKYLEYWGKRIPMDSSENSWRMMNKLKSKGIISTLKNKGLKSGEIIEIENSGFSFQWD